MLAGQKILFVKLVAFFGCRKTSVLADSPARDSDKQRKREKDRERGTERERERKREIE